MDDPRRPTTWAQQPAPPPAAAAARASMLSTAPPPAGFALHAPSPYLPPMVVVPPPGSPQALAMQARPAFMPMPPMMPMAPQPQQAYFTGPTPFAPQPAMYPMQFVPGVPLVPQSNPSVYVPAAPSVAPHPSSKVQAWIKDTPLPTALAMRKLAEDDDDDDEDDAGGAGQTKGAAHDSDDDVVGSVLMNPSRVGGTASTRAASESGRSRKSRTGGKGGPEAAVSVAPGRASQRPSGPPAVFVGDDGRRRRRRRRRKRDGGSDSDRDKSSADDDDDEGARVPDGWVRPVGNAIGNLYYDPSKPVVPSLGAADGGLLLDGGERGRQLAALLGHVARAANKRKRARAVSKKEVRALRRAAELAALARAAGGAGEDPGSPEDGVDEALSPPSAAGEEADDTGPVSPAAEAQEEAGDADSDSDGGLAARLRRQAEKQLEARRRREEAAAPVTARKVVGGGVPLQAKVTRSTGSGERASAVVAPGRSRRDVFDDIMADRVPEMGGMDSDDGTESGDDGDSGDDDGGSTDGEITEEDEEALEELAVEDNEDDGDLPVPGETDKMETLGRATKGSPPAKRTPQAAVAAQTVTFSGVKGDEESVSEDDDDSRSDAKTTDPSRMTQDQLFHHLSALRIRATRVHVDPVDAVAAAKALMRSVRFLSSRPRDQRELSDAALKAVRQVAAVGSAVAAAAVGPDATGAAGLGGTAAAATAAAVVVSVDAASGAPISCVADAQVLLAALYVRGVPGFREGHRPDYKRAFAMYTSAARRGHPDALYNVGVCYEEGAGVPASEPRALQYYRKAAVMNHPGAMYRLGMALLNGELGQRPSARDAIKWLRLSCKYADERYPEALYELALLHDRGVANLIWQDHEFVVQLLERGADLGHAPCNCRLGEAYEYGRFGCAVNPEKSVYHYSLAAGRGSVEAMFELGGWYLRGVEEQTSGFALPASEGQARKWVTLAAEGGLPRAMYALGLFLESGIGGPPLPIAAALPWYRRAAAAGDAKAATRLERAGEDVAALRRDAVAARAAAARRDRRDRAAGRRRDTRSAAPAIDGRREQRGFRETVQVAIGARHPDVPEELDGGAKCVVM